MSTKMDRLPPEAKAVLVLLDEALQGDARAQRTLKDAATGYSKLTEAISTSDFVGIFQMAINAQVEQIYTWEPSLWQAWAREYKMKGLRKEHFIDLFSDFGNLPASNGGIPTLPGGLPRVPEGTAYPAIAFTGGTKDIWTYKNGARLAFTWEAWNNDDWNVLQQLPQAMVVQAHRQEDLSATSVLVNSAGFNPVCFPAGNLLGGGGAGTQAPLTFTSLTNAITQASLISDPNRVNTITKWALIVPRSLAIQANNIIRSIQVELPTQDGSRMFVENTIGSIVEVIVNPYLTLLASGASYKNTMWMLAPYAGQGSDRTTIVQTFVRGREEPEMRIKNDQGQALGGGALDAYEGSFDADDTQIRIRHFTNTVVLDSTVGFVASKGDGT